MLARVAALVADDAEGRDVRTGLDGAQRWAVLEEIWRTLDSAMGNGGYLSDWQRRATHLHVAIMNSLTEADPQWGRGESLDERRDYSVFLDFRAAGYRVDPSGQTTHDEVILLDDIRRVRRCEQSGAYLSWPEFVRVRQGASQAANRVIEAVLGDSGRAHSTRSLQRHRATRRSAVGDSKERAEHVRAATNHGYTSLPTRVSDWLAANRLPDSRAVHLAVDEAFGSTVAPSRDTTGAEVDEPGTSPPSLP